MQYLCYMGIDVEQFATTELDQSFCLQSGDIRDDIGFCDSEND